MSTRESENFGANQWLIDELYEKYRKDPDSVDSSWQDFFASREGSATSRSGNSEPARTSQSTTSTAPSSAQSTPESTTTSTSSAQASSSSTQSTHSGNGEVTVDDSREDDGEAADDSAQSVYEARARAQGNGDFLRGDLPPQPQAVAVPAATTYRESAAQINAYLPESDKEDETLKLRGAAARTVTNMETSLELPVATSVRAIPAKVLVDNRIVINSHLARSRGGKVSYTHLIGFAMIEALRQVPDMNYSYGNTDDGKPALVKPGHINFGLAIDLPRPDGSRNLVVPSIKGAEDMDFVQYLDAYEDLVNKARNNELKVDDFMGTTVTLTNPGGIGTVHSIPRLMAGQGTIVGVGAMDYPAEFAGANDETLARIGVSKVLTLTSTYDHRIIQGAASGEFLRAIATKLIGEDGFWDRVFTSLRIPYEPVKWIRDYQYDAEQELGKPARIIELIHAYRSRGHLIADVDPVSYRQRRHPNLDITNYGLSLWDLERKFPTGSFGTGRPMKLRDILGRLRDAYCRTTGIEYMHLADREQRSWFQERLERDYEKNSSEQQLRLLSMLNAAEAFETFLQTKFVGQKRFSLEGGESLIPMLDVILTGAAHEGLDGVAIGMPHRGRLNVLANIAGKSYKQIFGEFEGNFDLTGSGDVKYHLGTEGVFTSPEGATTNVHLAANPSHLEAVDGVVAGIARGKQDLIDLGEKGFTILPIMIHGDASFAGQGVVAETLQMSQLGGYRVGGTVHIIVNNQIGFTTPPGSGRSSLYTSDVVKGLQVPIFHVNGDDPDAVARVSEMAFAYREAFHKDVVIDLVCYRRRGHNEADDPSMTQPVMYSLIKDKRSVRNLYRESLIGRGDITEEQADKVIEEFKADLDEAFEAMQEPSEESSGDTVAGLEKPESQREGAGEMVGWTSAVPASVLERVGDVHLAKPDDFTMHPKLGQLVERRAKMAHNGDVDWAMGELMAFGSLLVEGTPVRLTGQDSRRGTFVQRHAVFHDYDNGAEWTPLRHLTPDQAKFLTYDSFLSEYAALAFEYGYSVERPDALVLWEAQFGDFVNGGQIVIDEFISSAEQKWGQNSSLVMLLPHGYEGQGPDHSSARIERFLQLAAEDNMHIVQPTTPANHFHMLRTQAYARPRRPMIVFSPKQLLRLRAATSQIEDFTQGKPKTVIGEVSSEVINGAKEVDRVLLCSGRVYYDLASRRAKDEDTKTAIIRLEQLFPLDVDGVREALAPFEGAKEFVWVQDEPENQGPWPFMAMHLDVGRRLKVISRPAAAAPSAGTAQRHAEENAILIDEAFQR